MCHIAGIDTSGALGRFVANLLGALGEMERELIVERTRAGMAAARRRGARIGRPEAAVDRLALIRAVRAGVSVSDLARTLGVSWATARKLSKRVAADPTKSVEVARVGSGV